MENIVIQETDLSIRGDYAAFANYCTQLVNLLKNNLAREEHVFQSIRQGIYDLKPIYSGYASVEAIKKYNGKIKKMCKEHYNGRAMCARKIIEYIKFSNVVNLSYLVNYIKKSSMVHYTTSEENNRLVKFQNKPGYNWEEAYKAAGIILVKYDGIQTWYLIKGIKYYKTKQELKDMFNCTLYAVDNMIEAKGQDIIIV